jgi:hypothetical protein
VWTAEEVISTEIEVTETENEIAETIEDIVEEVVELAETAIEELGDAVETIADITEQATEEVVNDPPIIPEHNHEHSHGDLEARVAELEQKTNVLVEREVEDIIEESQPTEETPIATEEVAVEEIPTEETIIEPPIDRSEPDGPKGVFKFFKQIGW